MIRGNLIIAIDFSPRKGVKHERYSYRKDGTWYVVSCGPKYSNTHKVKEYDEAGLAWLEKHEVDPNKPAA